MRSADPRAAARAFVAAGRDPVDVTAAARAPFVKICGVTDEAGILAAVRAGADAIGLNFAPGTPRALSIEEGVALARLARAAASADAPAPRSWSLSPRTCRRTSCGGSSRPSIPMRSSCPATSRRPLIAGLAPAGLEGAPGPPGRRPGPR